MNHWDLFSDPLNWTAGQHVTASLKLPPDSTDATVNSLVLTDAADAAITLTPAFASNRMSYTAVVPNEVDEITITTTTTDEHATFTFRDRNDMELADEDSVKNGFQVLLSEGENTIYVKVTAEDDVTTEAYEVVVTRTPSVAVTVRFGQGSHTVDEGNDVQVKVRLSAAPGRRITIPLEKTNQGGASNTDYSGVPANVVFNSGDTEKTFTFRAASDYDTDAGESVKLEFGTLPIGVTAGSTNETTVSITDVEARSVTVGFDRASYDVDEGGTVTVNVSLSRDPQRTVTIPLVKTNQNGATSADYSGVPTSVTFSSGDTTKPFTFSAEQDVIDDNDEESVKLTFGTLPAGVSAGAIGETVVSISDDEEEGADYAADNEDTAASIAAGESWVNGNAVLGRIEHRYDQDWYRTVLRENRCYQIEVRGKDAWEDFQEYPADHPIQRYAPARELTLSDPLIHGVYTDLGNYMPDTQEEYGGSGLGAVKLVTIDQTGTVYIAVSHAWYGDDEENEGGGTFDLSLIELGPATQSCTGMDPSVTDAWASITYRRHHSVSEGEGRDLPGNISTTGYVQPDGDPATANIRADFDFDYFKVPLVAGRSYRIEVKGNEESDYGGTLENPRLALYSSPGGTLDSQYEELTSVTGDRGEGAADNNSGRGNNARLKVEVNVTDTYFIVVQPNLSAGSGTYTVVVTTIAN